MKRPIKMIDPSSRDADHFSKFYAWLFRKIYKGMLTAEKQTSDRGKGTCSCTGCRRPCDVGYGEREKERKREREKQKQKQKQKDRTRETEKERERERQKK